MELQRLKGQTVDGYGLNVSPDEALEIIVSLVSQLHSGVAVGRAEWQAEGAGYFSIFVTNNEKPPLSDAHPLTIDRSIKEPPCPSELDLQEAVDIMEQDYTSKELRVCGKCGNYKDVSSEQGFCSKRTTTVWRIGFAGKCQYYKEPSSEQMAHMDDIVLGAVPPPILCPNCKHPVDYEAEHIDGDPEDQSHYWYVCPEPPAKEPKKGVD